MLPEGVLGDCHVSSTGGLDRRRVLAGSHTGLQGAVSPEDEGGATAAEVAHRDEGRLCLMGVERGWLLLPVLVTGLGVGGVASTWLQVFLGRGAGVAGGVVPGVAGLGVAGGVGAGVASGVGSGGNLGESGGDKAMGAASGASFRGVEGDEEGGVAVSGSGGGLSVGGVVMRVLLDVRLEARICVLWLMKLC